MEPEQRVVVRFLRRLCGPRFDSWCIPNVSSASVTATIILDVGLFLYLCFLYSQVSCNCANGILLLLSSSVCKLLTNFLLSLFLYPPICVNLVRNCCSASLVEEEKRWHQAQQPEPWVRKIYRQDEENTFSSKSTTAADQSGILSPGTET